MNHSPWEGVTIADFVMPFFLFIVGVALALTYKLFCVGFVLQGGFFQGVRSLTFGVDIAQIRLMGILQRITIAYLVTALCQIWLKGEDDADSGLDLIKRYRYQLSPVLLPPPPLLSDAAVTGAALLARSRIPPAPMVRGSLPAPNPKPPPPSRHLLTSPLPSPAGLLPDHHHAVRADRGLRRRSKIVSTSCAANATSRSWRASSGRPLQSLPLLLATPGDAWAPCSARTSCSKPCSPGWAETEQEWRN
ncbi:hypothetical protein ZWY2020_020741 [Hordeum vulgare]|nr:hypothetical protein ZWY2020_020741 [Hordeum vulgare]